MAPPTDTRSFLKAANDHAHWLIQLADTKASYLMAASALLAGLLAQQSGYGCSDPARTLAFIAIALATAAATLLVLFPRTASRVQGNPLYHEAIQDFPSAAE